MNGDGIVDYEPGDVPDQGSAAQVLLHTAAINPIGEMQVVPVDLIVPAPGQRILSETWVARNTHVGWIEALGHGIVLNEVPLDVYAERDSARNPDGTPRDESAVAVQWAEENGYASVYEALIGQHRSELAKKCGKIDVDAYVLDCISAKDCAQLFVQDARTTRPLRGYDIHQAALVYGEPRARLIQAELDGRGIKLVPAAPRPNQVSCIRALEKACGDADTSAQAPDADLLRWHLDVLTATFPGYQWPDPLVQGLSIRTMASDVTAADYKVLGALAFKHWKGSVKEATESVRLMRKVTTSANPQAAASIWKTLFDAASIPLKVPKPKGTPVKSAAKAVGKSGTAKTLRKPTRTRNKVA